MTAKSKPYIYLLYNFTALSRFFRQIYANHLTIIFFIVFTSSSRITILKETVFHIPLLKVLNTQTMHESLTEQVVEFRDAG